MQQLPKRPRINQNSKPSPIEDLFADQMYPRMPDGGSWWMVRQAIVGRYTVDFLLHAKVNNKPFPSSVVEVVIECDGHNYHERTKEQAAHDRRRDRYLMAVHGLPTIRFTGSELHRDPATCAEEVLELVRELGRDHLDAYRDGIEHGWQRGIEHGENLRQFDIENGIRPAPPCAECARRERIDNDRIAAAIDQAERAGV